MSDNIENKNQAFIVEENGAVSVDDMKIELVETEIQDLLNIEELDLKHGEKPFDIVTNNQDEEEKIVEKNISEEDLLLQISKTYIQKDKEEFASVVQTRMLYDKDIRSLVATNNLLQSVFLFFAEKLNIELPTTKIDQNSGELINYKLRITADGSYSNMELGHIAIIAKKYITTVADESRSIRTKLESQDGKIAALTKELEQSRSIIRQLKTPIKYPTIEINPFVLAYLGNNGNYIYLGRKTKVAKNGNTIIYDGKVKDFAQATKFTTLAEAHTRLIALLRDIDHVFVSAYKMQIFSANLIEQTIPDESLVGLRERAHKFETLMQEKNDAKTNSSKKDKSDKINTKLKLKSKKKLKSKLKNKS